MINELYQLSCTLEKQGLLDGAQHHRDVHRPSKAKRLCFEIDETGKPSGLRLMQETEAADLWVHSHGNHDRFPAITIQQPLLDRTESEKVRADEWKAADLAQKREILRGLDRTNANPHSDEIWLRPWTLEQMAPVLESDDPDLEALRRLLRRFPRRENAEFYRDLRELTFQTIERADDKLIEHVRKLLVGEYKPNLDRYTAECATYFDIAEIFQVDCLVASGETARALVVCLCAAQGEVPMEADGISALTGKPAALVRDKYPNPDWKVIGPSYLFSNNAKANSCLLRYGMGGTETFPAGVDQVEKMCAALGFLMTEERKNITWRSFPGSDPKKPRLLLAWLEDNPQSRAELAQVLGADGAVSDYEAQCALVLKQLDMEDRVKPGSPVHLKLFETLDKGRKQIALSASFTTEQLRRDLRQCLDGAQNLPDISFRIRWKDRTSTVRPRLPGPGAAYQIMRINYRFGHGGEAGKIESETVPALSLQQAYQLYFPHCIRLPDSGTKEFYRQCLEQLLRAVGTLLSHVGYFQVAAEVQPFTGYEVSAVRSAVSLMGTILYQMDDRKEKYMESMAFLVGRFLKVADYLHKCYCIVVRNDGDGRKSLPGQLMGNALLQVALQNPQEALSRLSEKIGIYYAWADTGPMTDQEKGGKWIGYGKWAKALMEQTASALSALGALPTRLNEEERCELILGYLASLPEVQKQRDDSADKQGIQGDEKTD